MQNQNILQFRYFYFFYYWVDASVWWTVSPRGYSPAQYFGTVPKKTDIILKTYNTYKEPYLDHKINLVKILREYMHQKKAPARHVFPESGTKSQRDYEQLKHIVSSDT